MRETGRFVFSHELLGVAKLLSVRHLRYRVNDVIRKSVRSRLLTFRQPHTVTSGRNRTQEIIVKKWKWERPTFDLRFRGWLYLLPLLCKSASFTHSLKENHKTVFPTQKISYKTQNNLLCTVVYSFSYCSVLYYVIFGCLVIGVRLAHRERSPPPPKKKKRNRNIEQEKNWGVGLISRLVTGL